MDKKQAQRKAEKAYVDAIERDLKRAAKLLQNANTDNKQWLADRDAFLVELGMFAEPPNE